MTQPAALSTNRLQLLYQSPIGKKLLTGITGLTLALFVIVHMLGNLTLFFSTSAYNQFGHFLEKIWPLTRLIELVLALSLFLHASLGIQIWLTKRQARSETYAEYESAGRSPSQAEGKPSYQNLGSRSMVFSGVVLGSFLLWHLLTFKFGPHGSVVEPASGTEIRNLAQLVIETFQQPFYTVSYIAVFSLLALHLRHGLWSAWQSLGLLNQQVRSLAYGISLATAVLLALGFGALPVAILFHFIPGGALSS